MDITALPTFVIRDRMLTGVQSRATLEQEIQAAEIIEQGV